MHFARDHRTENMQSLHKTGEYARGIVIWYSIFLLSDTVKASDISNL